MRLPWVDTPDDGPAGPRDGAAGPDRWQRPEPTSRQRRLDVQSGLLLGAATVASSVLGRSVGLMSAPDRAGAAESVVWCLAVTLPLTVRRQFPLGSVIVAALAFIGLQSRHVPEQQLSSICLLLALYTAGAWGRDRQVARAVRIGVVVVMFAWLAYALSAAAWADHDYGEDADGPLSPAVASMIYLTAMNVLYFGAALGFGTMAWNQARQRALLDQRNAELAAEREENARRAVVAERLRIARELHDVVAHHVSLMGIQAAAARRLLDRDVELARSTLEGVEETGRSAVRDLHTLLCVLRSSNGPDDPDDPADPDGSVGSGGSAGSDGSAGSGGPVRSSGSVRSWDPRPGVDRLDELVARAARTGLSVELTVVGTEVPLPGTVSVSAYRIVQEALTNTMRHAAARRVDVRLRYLESAVEVEVVDDGRGVGSTSAGGRMGHLGMRERMAAHGGDLEIGPRPDGGFRVRARFPLGRLASPAGEAVR